jgi:hypothetical protein
MFVGEATSLAIELSNVGYSIFQKYYNWLKILAKDQHSSLEWGRQAGPAVACGQLSAPASAAPIPQSIHLTIDI